MLASCSGRKLGRDPEWGYDRRMKWIVVVLIAAGCFHDEPAPPDAALPAPSCQQAMEHYYDSQCVLFNPVGGAKYTLGEAVAHCQMLLGAAVSSCLDEWDTLKRCYGSAPSPASSDADCDCSREQDATTTCD